MLDVSTSFDGNDYATCVMPLGANDDNGDPINVYDVNNNDLLIISDMAKIYGRIVTVIQFSDIEDKYELLEEGRKALDRIQYNSRIIECSAADLHSKDGSKEIFKLGQLVHCYSDPHDLEIDLPLSKIELNLDTAAKNITLGIIKKKTLTRISRPKETEPYQQEPYTPEPYYPSPDPDWEIIMPDENGDPVTAIRMPIKITIARDPNKTEYEPGEALDFTGMIVNIWTKDKDGKEVIWTNPPKYTDGTAPMSELSFSTKTAPNVEEFSVQVIWKYKEKSYSALLGLRTKKDENLSWKDPITGITFNFMSIVNHQAGFNLDHWQWGSDFSFWSGHHVLGTKFINKDYGYGQILWISDENFDFMEEILNSSGGFYGMIWRTSANWQYSPVNGIYFTIGGLYDKWPYSTWPLPETKMPISIDYNIMREILARYGDEHKDV